MRTVNEKKIAAIKQAVIDLIFTDGVSNLTTAKVAKQAGISPATIYLHYKDKTDLLSRLYEEVKTELHAGLNEVIDQTEPLDEQIKRALRFSITKFKAKPRDANFMNALWNNQELLDQHAIEFGLTMKESLIGLYHRIQADSEYIDAPIDTLDAFFTVPTMLLAKDNQLCGQKLEQVYAMIIKAVHK